jgi:VWFA-related protein
MRQLLFTVHRSPFTARRDRSLPEGTVHRQLTRGIALALAAWLAMCSLAGAQGILITNLDAVDASAHPNMRALVTVTDENGIPVGDLDAKAFELNDDGLGTFPPDKVEVVANQKAAVSVMIVVDLSGTMRGKPLQAAKDAIGRFLEALLNEPNDPDRAAFIGFTQKVQVTDLTVADETREVGFTNDMGRLLNVINFVDVDTGTGGTPLYDAIFRAVKITAQQPGRRVILLMTDGKDQGSTLTTSDPIDEANRQRIPIFPIGLSTGRLDAQYLQRVALRTGGQYQSAPSPDELTQLFQNVLAQLKEQYVLSYTSRVPQPDGHPHTLTVQVTTSRGQNSSKLTYTLGQAVAPTPVPSGSTPAPEATVAPGATPLPTPGGTDMMQWISENTVLVIAIAAAGLLLLLMLVIAIVIVARRRGAAKEYEAGAYPQQSPEGETFPGSQPPAVGPVSGGISSMPTVSPAIPGAPTGAPTGAKTQLASSAPPLPSVGPAPFQPVSPPAPSPLAGPKFPPMPAPFQPAPGGGAPLGPGGAKPTEAPVTPPTSGSTVLIQRGPKMKVLGMLVDKKQTTRRFDIAKPAVTIGRAPGNDLIVDHPTVSRQHATIKLEGETFRLFDLGSANGTFVNEQRVRDPMVLEDGMTVRFGEVEYVFKRIALE